MKFSLAMSCRPPRRRVELVEHDARDLRVAAAQGGEVGAPERHGGALSVASGGCDQDSYGGRRSGRAAEARLCCHELARRPRRRAPGPGTGRRGRRRAGLRRDEPAPRGGGTDQRAGPLDRVGGGQVAGSTAAASRANSRSVNVRLAARGCSTTAAARCSRVAPSTRSAPTTCSATSSRARKSAPSTPYAARVDHGVRLHRRAAVAPGAGATRRRSGPAPRPGAARGRLRVSRSAIGERQMLPVQTCRTRKTSVIAGPSTSGSTACSGLEVDGAGPADLRARRR